MAKLTDLPTELIQQIATIGGRSPILEERDLASLSVVNWQFHRAVTPIYWRYAISEIAKPDSLSRRNEPYTHAAIWGSTLMFDAAVAWGFEPESPHLILLQACQEDHYDIVARLLDRGTKLEDDSAKHAINYYGNKFPALQEGCVPLKIAIDNGHEGIVMLLLSHGANPSFITMEGDSVSALHGAAATNMVQVAEYLIQQVGLPVDLPDYRGYTPLRYALTYSSNRDSDTQMLAKLIELGADVNSELRGELPLTSALFRAKYRHAAMLLDAGSKIVPEKPWPRVKFPIHALIAGSKSVKYKSSRQLAILHRIIDAGADLTKKYVRGYSPLKEAMLNGSENMLSHILEILGEDHPHPDDLLDDLVWGGKRVHRFEEKVGVVLKRGAGIDTTLSIGLSLLQWAIIERCEYTKFLEKLLSMANDSMLDRSYLDDLLADFSSGGHGFCGIYLNHLEVLVTHGARLKSLDEVYSSVLHMAKASPCHIPHWLDEGLDMGFSTEELHGLFVYALEKDSEELASSILRRLEPSLSEINPQWLFKAAKMPTHRIADKLLEHAKGSDLNYIMSGNTAFATVSNGRCSTKHISRLMELGADPMLLANQQVCHECRFSPICGLQGASALEAAIHHCSLELVKEMWQRITPESRPDARQFIPCVRYRCEAERAEIVAWLEEVSVKDGGIIQDEEAVREA
ncbi:hypothetical protein F5Y11DRAFT_366659 [Daldinia sp. FL1419]|nr:hypothetical protein F5Y11DRAFT_366659 [Daldinia sp. FL1419]